jgi:hypothetical protein
MTNHCTQSCEYEALQSRCYITIELHWEELWYLEQLVAPPFPFVEYPVGQSVHAAATYEKQW